MSFAAADDDDDWAGLWGPRSRVEESWGQRQRRGGKREEGAEGQLEEHGFGSFTLLKHPYHSVRPSMVVLETNQIQE